MAPKSMNTSPEAVALRKAAMHFAEKRPITDDADTDGQRRNKALLNAALAYASAVAVEIKNGKRRTRSVQRSTKASISS